MRKISTLLVFTALFLTGCKNEPNIAYQYQQNDDLFSCDAVDMKLIKEAVYAFEDYITDHYSIEAPKSVEKGYYFYWEVSKTERIPAVEFINPHVLAIRDELKKIEGLWITNNDGEAKMDMSHPLVKCIGDRMENEELKKIFQVLVETKTFKNSVFLAPLKRDPVALFKDRSLCTYFALNTFYARILNLDFTNMEELMLINRKKFLEEEKRLQEENLKNLEEAFKNGELIRIDPEKTKN
jgi:hypothetical protein